MENNDITRINKAVATIKTAILQSQTRAAQAVNQEQLALYFGIGRFVSENSRKGFWGQNAIESISKLLKTELPGLRGFSASMIKRMRTFYEEWREIEPKSVIPITENTKINNIDKSVIPITDLDMIYPLKLTGYEEFPIIAFLNISFSHHSMILRYTETLDERKYYIQLAYNQRLKVDDLETLLKAKVYEKQDRIPSNFFKTIPDKKLAMQTLQMFKDQYLLDFINVEEIDEMDPEDIDERVIEKQIVMNIKNYIMAFGRSFTYIGHQVHYDKLGHDSWVDLLFFNRELKSLVAIELKKGEFKPSYLGQLSAYLRILNDDEKLAGENPSIGLILCKKADKSFVEYVIQDYDHPMGVATYKTYSDMDERLKAVLPPKDELLQLINCDNEDDDAIVP
ncbi:MAG: PDDEXK nuclease domain-containing protein [Paludibacteraceae bacterium]|nr:PDDEXK nuclease domain-containing protein [Paludibacteraceae bacterium]